MNEQHPFHYQEWIERLRRSSHHSHQQLERQQWKVSLAVLIFLALSIQEFQLSMNDPGWALRPVLAATPVHFLPLDWVTAEVDWGYFTPSEEDGLVEPEAEKIPFDEGRRLCDPVKPTPKPAAVAAAEAPVSDKRQRQLKYIERFAKVAQGEMEKFGIPASITLAQGLLESDAGKSVLASRSNNHFGIKCFEKNCSRGHCTNFSDDSHKDFFRKFGTAWESYRAHSLFLQRAHYQFLYQLKSTDYQGWAKGLQKAGYATDQQYAQKLIRLIEELGLQKYDQ